MHAIVYDAVGQTPRYDEVPAPPCPPRGAIIDVTATGICRSDWYAWCGHQPVTLPMIPGHEFVGTVAQVGPQVSTFFVGDRVTAPFVNGCGRCSWCTSGSAQVCPHQTQPGFTHHGALAEQVAIDAADFNLVRLPDDLTDVGAAALGCRFATAYHCLTTQSDLAAGQWLLVVGCGGVGLSAVLVSHAMGARTVVVDPSASARARALELGARIALPAAIPEIIADLTDGGVHVSLDAVGSAETTAACVMSLRRRGRHVQVGLARLGDEQVPLPWHHVVARELHVVGCHGMPAAEYPRLLRLISARRLDPEQLVGCVINLSEAGDALTSMNEPAPVSAGIVVAAIKQ